MNAENFATYLKNPTQLYQISYQELKTLVLQYPYCQNLRFLLLLKSQIDQNSDFDKNLQKAATYSFDRSYLFKQFKTALGPINPVVKDNYQITEEVLELDQIEANEVVEREILQILQSRIEEEQKEEEINLGTASSEEEFELNLEDLQLVSTSVPTAILAEQADVKRREIEKMAYFEVSERLVKHLASIQRITKNWKETLKPEVTHSGEGYISKSETSPINQFKGAMPMPKTAFGAKRKQNNKIKWTEVSETKKKNKKIKVIEFAEQSIKDNAGNASETLAYLLTEQGFYDKAIEIYQRLILLFPMNRRKYLESIEDLKSKL